MTNFQDQIARLLRKELETTTLTALAHRCKTHPNCLVRWLKGKPFYSDRVDDILNALDATITITPRSK